MGNELERLVARRRLLALDLIRQAILDAHSEYDHRWEGYGVPYDPEPLREGAEELAVVNIAIRLAAGATWETIGLAEGVSRQAAHAKYAEQVQALHDQPATDLARLESVVAAFDETLLQDIDSMVSRGDELDRDAAFAWLLLSMEKRWWRPENAGAALTQQFAL